MRRAALCPLARAEIEVARNRKRLLQEEIAVLEARKKGATPLMMKAIDGHIARKTAELAKIRV